MEIKTFVSATLLGFAVVSGASALAQDPPAQTSGYAWADSCKTCHQAEYDSWAKTKHATALTRLSGAEQEKECIGCHVTGAKTRVMDGNKKVLNAGVQCEACHGGAAAHAADPAVKTGLVKVPAAAACEQCHNDKGPHFKGFWYDAMKTLVHKK
jgi:cytochrome c554/c'-like protein